MESTNLNDGGMYVEIRPFGMNPEFMWEKQGSNLLE
jgi:hypothetical protein